MIQFFRVYKCMPTPELNDGLFSMVAVQPEHIEPIRQWRNTQMGILRQSAAITPEDQESYYRNHIWPEMCSAQPKNILLAYLKNGSLIGYGGLVHIKWEHSRAEISFLLEPQLASANANYNRYFSNFLRLIKALAFNSLGLSRLATETYSMRKHHIAILESAGFRREGTLKHHVLIDGQPVDSIIHGCLQTYEQ